MTGFTFRNIKKQKRRSDELLLNILPAKTAEELKESGKVKAKKFDSVTVMFTDFQGIHKIFTKLISRSTRRICRLFFSKFDQIIDTYELEKIKTIGDAYMCAGGLTLMTLRTILLNVIQAAFEIQGLR